MRWQTPIIAQVMLTAHAATSGEGDASTRYFVDTTNEEGHFHLLTVEIPAAQTPSQAAAAGNLTARFVHVNNRRLVRREGTIAFAVGATGYLYTTATGGSACNNPLVRGAHTVVIKEVTDTTIIYDFTNASGELGANWLMVLSATTPTVPSLPPC